MCSEGRSAPAATGCERSGGAGGPAPGAESIRGVSSAGARLTNTLLVAGESTTPGESTLGTNGSSVVGMGADLGVSSKDGSCSSSRSLSPDPAGRIKK